MTRDEAPGWGADPPGWDAEPGGIDADGVPARAPRRAVGASLVAVVGVVIAASGAGSYLVYRHESQQVHRYAAQVVDLHGQLAAAKQRASSSFVRGMTARAKIDMSLGNAGGGGFQAGWTAAFGGFASWQDGTWYLVKIVRGDNGHEIGARAEVPPCQRVYLSRDRVYTQGAAC